MLVAGTGIMNSSAALMSANGSLKASSYLTAATMGTNWNHENVLRLSNQKLSMRLHSTELWHVPHYGLTILELHIMIINYYDSSLHCIHGSDKLFQNSKRKNYCTWRKNASSEVSS